jgi:hypothetical protein
VPRYVTCELTHLITIFSNLYPFCSLSFFVHSHSLNHYPTHTHTHNKASLVLHNYSHGFYRARARTHTHTHTHTCLYYKSPLISQSHTYTFYQILTAHTCFTLTPFNPLHGFPPSMRTNECQKVYIWTP